jgi:hypothetical protein
MEGDRLSRLVEELREVQSQDIKQALPHVTELMDALRDVLEAFSYEYEEGSPERGDLHRAWFNLELFVERRRTEPD